jgi:serine/threonine-protein kinase
MQGPNLPRLGAYQLVRELGRGAMGVVYLARAGDREVAIKVMLVTDRDAVARFEREIELASRIRHPGLVPVIDTGFAEGRRFFVMEYCPGETLRVVLARGPMTPGAAARLVRSLADAVAAAHAEDVLHRDLKPANIIMTDAGPRITDFGLARDLVDARRLTASGIAVGTPAYMAPEQLEARRDIDERVDVYALGLILYQAMTGRHPFAGATIHDTTKLVLAGRAPRPETVNVAVPPGLGAIALQAMRRERSERMARASDLREALDRFLEKETGASVASRGRRKLVAAAAGAVLALGVLAAFFVPASRPPAPPRPAPAEKPVARAVPAPPVEKAESVLARARRRLEANDLGAAERTARELLARPELDATVARDAWLVLGRALARDAAASRDEAREAFAKLDAADEGGARGLYARASLAYLDERLDDAESLASKALERERLPSALVLLCRSFVASYAPERVVHRVFVENRDAGERRRGDARARAAIASAEEAIELAPDDADALVARSLALAAASDRSALVRGGWIVPGNPYAQIDADLDHALELDGSNPDPAAMTLRARILWLGGRGVEARDLLDRAVAAGAGSQPVEARLLRALLEPGTTGDARQDIERELEDRPRAAFALARFYSFFPAGKPLGRLVPATFARLLEEPGLAREHDAAVRARIARAPDRARSELEQATSLAREGRPLVELRPRLDAALAAAPGDPTVGVEVARLFLGRGEAELALACLGSREGASDPLTERLRGEALLLEGDRRGAREAFERSAAGAKGAPALVARAEACRAAGDVPGARRLAEQACRLAPGDADAHAALAAALVEGAAVEADAAVAEAQRAVAIAGRADAALLYHEARARALRIRELGDPPSEDRERVARLHDELATIAPAAPWAHSLDELGR